MLNIDLNGIKNGCITAYHIAVAKTSEWMGKAIVIVKSGSEQALPYLQDKRIAAVSLITVNLILIEIGELFNQLVQKCLPRGTREQRAFGKMIGMSFGLATVGVGVIAFAKYTKLPFSALMIVGISVGTIFIRALFSQNN